MRSRPAVVAGVTVLLALPLTLVAEILFGAANRVAHLMLGAGLALTFVSVRDFEVPRWAMVLGWASSGTVAMISLLQAFGTPEGDDAVSRLAFQTLGQRVEGLLALGLWAWCLAIVAFDSRDRTRVAGLVMVTAALLVVVQSLVAFEAGRDDIEALKLVYIVAFGWLLLEGRKASTDPTRHPAPAVMTATP